VLSTLLSALHLRLQLVDSRERGKPRRTGHFGVRWGQHKECVLKLSWPSTAEYRMMKLKNKTEDYLRRTAHNGGANKNTVG